MFVSVRFYSLINRLLALTGLPLLTLEPFTRFIMLISFFRYFCFSGYMLRLS